MKWYWILLIVLGSIAVGVIVSQVVKSKSKASSPVKVATASTNQIGPRTTDPSVQVASNGQVDVITKDNADGTKTVAIARVAQ